MAAPTAPRRRRAPWIVVAIIAAAAVLYGTVVALYALGGEVESSDPNVPADVGAVITIRPQAVDAVADQMTLVADIALNETAIEAAGGQLGDTVTLLVSAAVGDRTLELPVGSILSPVTITLLTDGLVEQWPFDVHRVTTTFIAYWGEGAEVEVIPTYIIADGRVPGWAIRGDFLPDETGVIDGQKVQLPIVELTASRAGSTVAFGLVLLLLMAAVPVIVLWVVIAAYRGRRKVEPTFLGWIGAMLFATIPLRTFLPGSPPIGSWVDFLLVLWVFAALIAALAIFAAAWMRWSPRPGATPSENEAGPTPPRSG